MGDKIEVKVLRVDAEERKIGLSRKRVEWAEEEEQPAPGGAAKPGGPGGPGKPAAPSRELKGGVGGGGPLIQPFRPAAVFSSFPLLLFSSSPAAAILYVWTLPRQFSAFGPGERPS